MEERNKYYTPSLDEFHVGFEYENWVKGRGWTKRIVEVLGRIPINERISSLVHDDYRVKYLDKEDVESLGFIQNKNSLYIQKQYDIQKGSIDIMLLSDGGRDKSCLYIKHDGLKDIVFSGTIKNKSELKKLLHQLQII